ncbi:unnamed protein product [Cylicocyclus nassatus]|uniref:Uncharacterized protein n=1 Tax=Cylicocyclus nassatus TaxID=53992 RepID=A0AA36DLI1_CYLNA|nr:unnamed protein product [Cylicocyclus nassatus]
MERTCAFLEFAEELHAEFQRTMSRKLFFVLVMLVCAVPENYGYKYDSVIAKRCIYACGKECSFSSIRRAKNGELYFPDGKCRNCFYDCAIKKETRTN